MSDWQKIIIVASCIAILAISLIAHNTNKVVVKPQQGNTYTECSGGACIKSHTVQNPPSYFKTGPILIPIDNGTTTICDEYEPRLCWTSVTIKE